MSEFTPLREAVDTLASRSPSPDFGELNRRATRRGRRRLVMVAAATAVVIAGSALAFPGLDHDRQSAPVEQPKPGIVVGAVPVWYDAQGLHHGDVVEQTPVELRQLHGKVIEDGALALVRTGALYLDPATGDIWFHPWGGNPRIIGHNSSTGPGGDPNGDTAAWFERTGFGGEKLVVYDTAEGREISRKVLSYHLYPAFGSNTCHSDPDCLDPAQPGNGFLEVSAERVVWNSGGEGHGPSNIYDVRTGKISVSNTKPVGVYDAEISDVHHDAAAYSVQDKYIWGWHLVLDMPGRALQDYPKVNPRSRFSSSGNYVTSVSARVEGTGRRYPAAIIDTGTGELWPVPETESPWIAWSYGDIALVDTQDELLACDAARRTCAKLPAEPPFLMPTN